MKRARLVSSVAAVVALAASGVLLVGPASSAATTQPPYEPDPGAVGTLSFFDASGNQITTGSINTAPLAAYVVGSVAGRTGDHSTLLNMAQPNPNANTGNWNKDTLTGQSDYPLPAAGNPANIVTMSQTLPVSKGTSGDFRVADFIGEFPNTDPSGPGCAYSATPSGCTNTQYQNLYELRLITTNGADQNTQYENADILVSGTTWTQVYPVPSSGPTATTTALAASPASPQNAGTDVTLTATVAPGTAAGSVQFKDGSTNLGSAVAVSSGTASMHTTTLSVGTHSLTAVFTPTDSTAFSASTSTAVSYVIQSSAVSTSTTLTPTPASPITVGTQTSLDASVTPATAGGAVQFKDGATNLGSPVTVSGGHAMLNQTFAVGTHSLTAQFIPTDSTAFSGSTSLTVSYLVNPQPATPTTTALAVSLGSPQTYGTPLGMTATVTPSNAVGSVQFLDGAIVVATGTVSGGTATGTTSTLSAGDHSLTAQFVPSDATAFGTSLSAAQAVHIDPASSTTMLSATPAGTAQAGATVTLSAAITPSSATGTVQFFDGSSAIGSPATVTSGTATTTVSTLGVGDHTLTATFTADNGNVDTSTSDPVDYTITKPPPGTTATALTATPTSPAAHGATETLVATITPAAATGMVQFSDNGSPLGSPVAVSGGTAQMTTTLSDGVHLLGAAFTSSDETTFTDSSATPQSYTVNPPAQATTTTLSSTPTSPVTFGTSVSLTATVSPSTAVGSVQFVDGSTAIGSPVTVSGGTATTTTVGLEGGTHSLTAVFTPTSADSFTASTSSPVSLSVTAAATTTSLTVSPTGPIGQGDSVTMTATVNPGTAAGTVQFRSGATILGTQPLTGGTATYTSNGLPVGTALLSAVFAPTSPLDFVTSSSATVSMQVNPGPVVTSLLHNGQSVAGKALTPGESLVLTAADFGAGKTVTLTLHSTPVTLATVTADSTGVARASFTLPTTTAPGAHTITVSDGTHSVTIAITVVTAAVGGTSTSIGGVSATGGTADTGVDVRGGLLVGLALAALGAVATSVGRRGRRGQHRLG
jgi:hypothetical protein